MPAARPTSSSRPWRSHWPALLLALVAAAVAIWAKRAIFPALSWNRDEPVYLWHVDLLREGRLTAPDGGHPDLFLPWLSAARDGEMFTQYTLGWPLVLLAARLVTGTATAALPLGAALAVAGTYALTTELFDDRRRAALAGGLLVLSPILPIQGGVHLSYLFTLGLGLFFGALLLSGHRRDRPGRVVLGGVLLGAIFLTRPYDAVLWGAAFAAYLLVTERERSGVVLRRLVVCGAGALPLVIAGLAYNRRVTGAWLEFPITVADPLDTFGFGRRRLMPGFPTTDYDLPTALKASAKNAFVLPWFLVGSYLTLVLAALGLWQGRRERATLALLLVGAVFPLGYFVFWGNHLSSLAARISGPIYLVPLFAPICILAASVLLRWWTDRRALAWAVGAAMVVVTVPLTVNRLDTNRDVSVQQTAWRASTAGLEGPALVLVQDTGDHLLYANPFGGNDPDLDDNVLFAALSGPSVLDLVADEPDRALYVQSADVASPELGPREDPYPLHVELTPAEVRRGSALTLTASISAPPGADIVDVEVTTGAATHRESYPGTDDPITLQVDLDPRSGPPGGALALGPEGRIQVTVSWGGRGTGPLRWVRQELLYRVDEGRVEALVPAESFRRELVKGRFEWRHAPALPELGVDLTPAPGGS